MDLLRSGRAIALVLRQRASTEQVGAVLVYHAVDETAGDLRFEIVAAHGAEVFRRQVGHIARHYRPIPVSELLAAVRYRRRWQRIPIAITFDDDLLTHHDVAAPILKQAGATATFFLGSCDVPPAERYWVDHLQWAIDERAVTPADLPELDAGAVRAALERVPRAIGTVAKEFISLPDDVRSTVESRLRALRPGEGGPAGLSAEQMRALADDGFEIGFHTVRHERLTALDDEELARALDEGRERLAEVAGQRILAIAYPYGRADQRVADAAVPASYSVGFTVAQERITRDANTLLLGRFEPPFVAGGSFALQLARFVRGVTYG